MRKPKRSKQTTKIVKQSDVATKPAKEMKATPKSAPTANSSATRSRAARAHIAEGSRLFAFARRPTKAQFVKVYGAKGPTMTWAQRAKAGVDAKHFQ
jgi:hypothetical protein